MITLQQLVDTDAAAISAAAQAWAAAGAALDDATEDLLHGTRHLEDVWPDGPAAAAAHARTRDTVHEASNAVPPCRVIARALREHADTVRGLQDTARQIAAEAAAQGYLVELAGGTVSAGFRQAHDSGQAQAVAHAIASYTEQFQGILDRAAELDRTTVAVLAAHLPHARDGFGHAGAAAVSEAALRAQQGRHPGDVRDWWEGLTPAQQEDAIRAYPGLVGALDGVPATDRDPANRILLAGDIATLRTGITDLDTRERLICALAEQGRLGELYPGNPNPTGAARHELDRIADRRDDLSRRLGGATLIENRLADPGKPAAYLMGFSAADDGRVILAVGNPDTADNVVTYIPGTTADLRIIGVDVDRADRMSADAGQLTPGRDTAAVLWLGYDAPDRFTNAANDAYAERAAPDLRAFQTGLRATHDGPPSHNTVIGHSYGSTVAGFAARDNLATDNLIFVGSPGVGVENAGGLHVESSVADRGRQTSWQPAVGHVYASTTPFDAIDFTGLGDHKRYGLDPTNRCFGAAVFTSANASSWDAVANHSAYWDQGNPSRRNIALIIAGRGNAIS
jgi:hypothetical protein